MTLRLVKGGRYRLRAGKAVQLIELAEIRGTKYWRGEDLDTGYSITFNETGRYSAVAGGEGHDLDIVRRILG